MEKSRVYTAEKCKCQNQKSKLRSPAFLDIEGIIRYKFVPRKSQSSTLPSSFRIFIGMHFSKNIEVFGQVDSAS
jgi:hypothetical protein